MNARVDTSVLSHLSNRHLDALEEETIFVLREVAAAFERPALLFSGGKDSLVMLRCAEKAFGKGRIPYPLLMIDTGHNFPEVTAFRDSRAQELGAELIVRSVEDSMKRGTVRLAHPGESRNAHQSVTLLEAIEEFRFDALIGGARRDEEKARAKERIFSHRDSFGQWQPKDQRPELWTQFNTRLQPGEHFRVFPISNWTELDVWQSYYDLQTSVSSVSSATNLVKSATESAAAAAARYKAGVGSLLDFITAQQDDTNARVAQIQSYLDWYSALSRLNFALGASDSDVIKARAKK